MVVKYRLKRKFPCQTLKKKDQKRGVILVVTTIISIFMLILITPFLVRLSGQYRTSEKSYKSVVASNLAEAGIEKAIWELNYGDISSWSGDSSKRTATIPTVYGSNGNNLGSIEICVTGPNEDSPLVEAIGRVPLIGTSEVTRKVIVTLKRKGAPLFDYGVFAGENVTLNEGVAINGTAGTNGTSNIAGSEAAILNANAQVAKDVLIGVGGDTETAIKLNSGAVIGGSKQTLDKLKEFPTVSAPELTQYAVGIIIDGTSVVDETQSGNYPLFIINADSTAITTGNVTLSVEYFAIGRGGTLLIENGASLTVYINSSIIINNSCYINNEGQDATKCLFYGTDNLTGDIEFSCLTEFYGAIYMPNANLSLARDFDVTGAVYAKKITLNRNVNISYDEGLGNKVGNPGNNDGAKYSVESWQEKTSIP